MLIIISSNVFVSDFVVWSVVVVVIMLLLSRFSNQNRLTRIDLKIIIFNLVDGCTREASPCDFFRRYYTCILVAPAKILLRNSKRGKKNLKRGGESVGGSNTKHDENPRCFFLSPRHITSTLFLFSLWLCSHYF